MEQCTTKVLLQAKNLNLKIISVILFGSCLQGDFEENISDVDVIFVVDDSSTDSAINSLQSYITRITDDTHSQGIISHILQLVSRRTGMFISGFVCRESSFRNLNFSEVFGVSKILANILAPSNLVLNGMLSNYAVIMGKDLLSNAQLLQIDMFQIIRSLLMNLLLSISSLLICMFSSHAIRYSLESLKWSILSCHFYVFKTSSSLSRSVHKLGLDKRYKRIIKRLLQLRKHPTKDPFVSLLAPWYVIRFHIDAYHISTRSDSEIDTQYND